MMRTRTTKTLSLFLIASFLLHLSGFLTIKIADLQQTRDPSIEVVLTENTSEKTETTPLDKEISQIVDQGQKPINQEKPRETKYASAFDQTVKKETIARNRGQFKNSPDLVGDSGGGTPKTSRSLEQFKPQLDLSKMIREQNARDEIKEKDLEELALKNHEQLIEKQKQQQASQQTGNAGPQASQTLDYIKNLDPGLETLLSTKEFVYFSYYSRIREQLNQHWGPKVKDKLSEVYRQGRSIASSDDKITRCLITLDSRGKLVRIQIIGDSGIRELDEAAIEAFRAAAPFPNPPKGMVDADGTIKLRWDFILEA